MSTANTSSKTSLFDAIGDREKTLTADDQAKQHLEEGVAYLEQFAAHLGAGWPWPSYVRPVGQEEPRWLTVNVDLNRLPLSSKIIPMPSYKLDAISKRSFDEMAIVDSAKATLHPMIATTLFVYTPPLLMLTMANPSRRCLDELRASCLEVAQRWRQSSDEKERQFLLQNLVELQDIFAAEKERLDRDIGNEHQWPICMNVTEVIAQYRRVMNLIRQTRGFADIDEQYAGEMTLLIDRCDKAMARELQGLMKNNPIEGGLQEPLRQMQKSGSVYSLRDVNVVKFQELLIEYTFSFIHIMERWILRVTAPGVPHQFHFYHLCSKEVPDQNAALGPEEQIKLRNTLQVADRARSSYSPYAWPEFHRCSNFINSLVSSLHWPADPSTELPLPHHNRVAMANSIVACVRALTKSFYKEEHRLAAMSAFEILGNDNYSLMPWSESQWFALLPNPECPHGEELPIILAGLSDAVFA